MSKVHYKKVENVLNRLAETKLSTSEFQVFLAWFTDSAKFAAPLSVLAKRTGLFPSNVSRAIRGLVQKEVLVASGALRGNKDYRVHPRLLEGHESETEPYDQPDSEEIATVYELPDPLTESEQSEADQFATKHGLSPKYKTKFENAYKQTYRGIADAAERLAEMNRGVTFFKREQKRENEQQQTK